MSFKLGLVSISFRKHSPEEILKAMKECGLEYIEWGSDVHAPCNDTENLKSIVNLQKEYGIGCSSYGTYFRFGVNEVSEIKGYVDAAKILGTDIIRLWCGAKNSQDYSEAEKSTLFEQCKEAAKIAETEGVVLCMECHNNTYTNTKESALELMQAVNSKHFRMYWQPNQYRTVEENILCAKLLKDYTYHLHVFNWEGDNKYPLGDGKEVWKKYLDCFDGNALLLEFMPDNEFSSLPTEAKALKEIVEETLQ
ncbi:MAG: sugar phosphate isomerase/epimerase [Clostridia bacterium]|nr:sugar phosphate isomerase/epimerase [Clostridia bacterium]